MSEAALSVEPCPGEDFDLWRAMQQGSADARERLFADYLPFARSLARRRFRTVAGAGIEFNDLFQLACAGLLEAMDRFDPQIGVPFRGFAARRINGSILDGLAKMTEVQEQISFRRRCRSERLRSLAAGNEGAPGERNAMEALIDVAVGLAIGIMLEGTGLYHEESAVELSAGAYENAAWKDLVQRVLGELSRLPEREREIVKLHYLEDVTFEQIASLLEVSKSRISQLHKAAMTLIRRRLSATVSFHLER